MQDQSLFHNQQAKHAQGPYKDEGRGCKDSHPHDSELCHANTFGQLVVTGRVQ